MAARNVLHLFHADAEGDVLASKTIAVTKPDGSPLGVSLYDQVAGGSPVTSPQTNSVGTSLLYADYADLDAQAVGRVKVSYGDAPATTFDDALWPDPLDLFVDGMTRNRALGGALAVGGTLGVTGLTTAAGGVVANRNSSSAYALTVRNTSPTTPKHFAVYAADGSTPILRIRRTPGGNDLIHMDAISPDADIETSRMIVGHYTATHYVVSDSSLTAQGIGGPAVQDAGAMRAVADQRNAGGNSLIRAGEFHVRRIAPAANTGSAGAWCLELAMISDVPGNTNDQNVGIYCNSTNTATRGDTALFLTGGDAGGGGWSKYIRCMDNDRLTMLAQIDQTGLVTCSGVVPRTASVYQSGTLAKPWAGVCSVAFSPPQSGNESGPQFNQFGYGQAGLYVYQNTQTGITVGSADHASLNSSGLFVTKGFTVGTPTGGFKGTGTANFAADIYKQNVAYVNPHGGFEQAYTGRLERYADRMAAMGLPDYRPLSLDDLEAYTREYLHFPYFGDEEGNGLFGGAERHLLITEELAVHLFSLHHRVQELERRVA